MQNPQHELEWNRIVSSIRKDVPRLVDDFMDAFKGHGSYGDSNISEREFRTTAHEVLGLLTKALAGEIDETEFRLHADSLGRRRAQQQVPIASLVDAVQLDFSVIWNRLREEAGPENIAALIDHVDRLHNIVAKYNYFVRYAFRSEQAKTSNDVKLINSRYIDRIFVAENLNSITLEEATQVLKISADTPCEVLVFHECAAIEARAALDPLTASGEAFGHPFRGMYVVFWESSRREDPAFALLREPKIKALPGIHFPTVHGLTGVRSAVRSTPRIFFAAGKPAKLEKAQDQIWAVAGDAIAAFPESSIGALTNHIAALRQQKDPIIATLEAYLDTGSIKLAAEMSYCHRNTVINRLNQFAALTGMDVTKPKDAAYVLLASRRMASAVPQAPTT